MIITIAFISGMIVGYGFAVWGSIENMRHGKSFWKRDDGSWYPYDPTKGKK